MLKISILTPIYGVEKYIDCCLLSLLSSMLAHTMIYSPWVIYFSILSTQWLVRFIKMKRKSDLVLTILFLILSVLAFAGFIRRLLEVRV